MEITPRVAMEVAAHEGLVRQAYKDSVGVWTWSIGLTAATGHDVKRYIDNPQPLRRCLEVYIWALNNYADAVRAEFKGHALTEEQFGAALSFHWNTGAIRSATWPDMWKEGNLSAARVSFLSWKKPSEIIPRRQAEAALMFDGKWYSDGTMIEYTRVRSSGIPDWGSAKRISIANDMKSLLGAPEEPIEQNSEIDILRQKLAAIKAIVEAEI